MQSEDYILVIEDDAFQQAVIESMIKKCIQTNVVCVANGFVALKTLEEKLPSLVICDLNMPVMDGVDFLHQLSMKGEVPPVCILSGVQPEIQRSVIEMTEQYGIKYVVSIEKPLTVGKVEYALSQIELGLVKTKQQRAPKPDFSLEELESALMNEDITPYFQPQVLPTSQKIVSLESLARWEHPERGLLTPFHFLESITEKGLLYSFFQSIFSQSIAQASALRQQGYSLGISVNVTPTDLIQEGFIRFVMSTLEQYDYPAHLLTIELTETEVTEEVAKLLHIVCKLRINGIELAIDDFGTGNSSLSQLISSPFTELKIDLSFVREMLTSHKHMAAVSSSVMLAKNLNLKTVAEGVETKEQADKLTELGCDLMQGYFYHKPMSGASLVALLANGKNNS